MAQSLAELAPQFKALTRDIILEILMNNKMRGNIECGYRVWLHSCITLPYKHPLEIEGLNVCAYIRELTYNAEGISCYPSEQSENILDSRIRIVATHLYRMHSEMV